MTTSDGDAAGSEQLVDRFFSLERVDASVRALQAVSLGRASLTFSVWMFAKRSGLQPGGEVFVTSVDCQQFASDFFAMPTADQYGYFLPFNAQWVKGGVSSGSDWAVQTLFTQLDRPNDLMRRIFSTAEKARFDRGGRTLKGRKLGFLPQSEYDAGLAHILGTNRGPARELAIWRHRRTAMKGLAGVLELALLLMHELNVDLVHEYPLVFQPDPELEAMLGGTNGGSA